MGADDADGDEEDEDRLQIWNVHRLIGLRLVILIVEILLIYDNIISVH